MIIFCFHHQGSAQVAQFTFDEISGESQTLEGESFNTFTIENYKSSPERIEGVKGNALRLDGYSTWVNLANFSIPNVSDEMTVEFWYATESFNAENSGLVHQKDSGKGFALSVSPYGELIAEFYADGEYYAITTTQKLEKYTWNHIALQIDLPQNKGQLFVNGDLWGEKSTDDHSQIDLNDNLTYIGRSNRELNAFGFPLTVANGAIDELKFYNRILDEASIQEHYNQSKHLQPNLAIDPEVRHANDYLRPRYHPMPNTSWTNESYGFTYFNEKYHLFFQKNPNAPILNFMHWGHISSPDLVNWTEEKIVLAPKEGFSSKGVWSGTTFFDKDNEPVIAYTGVNGAFAGIGIAFPKDSTLNDWLLYEDNPVIPSAPSNINHLDFRDPYIWCEGGTFYMIVGSGLQDNGGGILPTYTSSDLINWINIPSIYNNTNASQAGTFWEMPYFNKITEDDFLLVVTPQFTNKPAETIYWIGSFDGTTFTPYNHEPKKFEILTRHLLSPAIGLDEEGRITYSGIIPEDRDVVLQVEAGWRHLFSLPRVLRILDDGETLGHIPHPNLCRARRNDILIENRMIEQGSNFNLPEYQGTQSELYFKIYAPEAKEFQLQVFKNEAATQLTSITFDKVQNRIGINRVLSSTFQTVENIRTSNYHFNPNDTIEVTVFLDRSVMEVFVDNSVVMSARVYPSEGSQSIDIVAKENGNLELVEFRAWDIVDKEILSPSEVCEIGNLPGDLFSSINEIYQSKENMLTVFPNPASDVIYLDQLKSDCQIYIYNSEGILSLVKNYGHYIDISALPPGFYVGALRDGTKVSGFNFVKI